MKRGIVLNICLMCFAIIGCSNQKSQQGNIKDELIRKWLATEQVDSSNTKDKITILKTSYCETNDCEEYFREYDQIQIYNREDAFMRAIKEYYEIESIDEKEGVIILYLNRNGKRGKMEIRT